MCHEIGNCLNSVFKTEAESHDGKVLTVNKYVDFYDSYSSRAGTRFGSVLHSRQ